MNNYQEKADFELNKTLSLLDENEEVTLDSNFHLKIESRIKEGDSYVYFEKFKLNYVIPAALIILFLLQVLSFANKNYFDFSVNERDSESSSVIIKAYYLSDY